MMTCFLAEFISANFQGICLLFEPFGVAINAGLPLGHGKNEKI